jgi:methyltransferase (TIGR00027 family)
MRSQSNGSLTSETASAARAAHLIVDHEPYVFVDRLAGPMLGDRAEELIAYHREHGDHPVLVGARVQVVTRARVAERQLATAAADQYVILGAGLDSFAHRSPLAEAVHVFEVDHPATQAAKRERLAALRLESRGTVSYVPADFERDELVGVLHAAGFDRDKPAMVSWLGVCMYLTRDAVGRTLDALGVLAPGSDLVLDYMLPAGLRDEAGQTYVDLVAPAAAERGEPWLSFFAPDEMDGELSARGFGHIASYGQREALDPGLWDRTDALRPARLSMIACARRLVG